MYVESIVKTLISCITILGLILIYRVSIHQLVKTNAEKLWFAVGVFVLFSMVTVFNHTLEIKNDNVRYYTAVAFELLWWLSLYYLINQMVQHWVWDNFYAKKGIVFSRVFHDLISIFLFMLTLIAIVHFVFDKSVFGIFTASGVLVIIVAYSAQVYLSDVFAGLEIYNAKEFVVGDWIKFNDQVAKVVEINWQYVKLLTRENNQLSMANSVISKLPVVNLSRPSQDRIVCLSIPLCDATSPGVFKKMLVNAALQSPSVFKSPPPTAQLLRIEDDHYLYQLTYHTQEVNDFTVNNDILSIIWYMARRQKIKIAAYEPALIELPTLDEIRHFLKESELFGILTKDELNYLTKNAITHHYGPPERVLDQGQNNTSLFLIYSGSVDILLTNELHPVYVTSLKQGQYFGEMSFLTGEACSASVYIKEEAVIIEISHDNMAAVFAKNPGLIEQVSEEIMLRKQQNAALHANAVIEHNAVAPSILDSLVEQVKAFFHH